MKKTICNIAVVIALLLLLSTGIFTNLLAFFEWLILLKNAEPSISVAGSIIVRLLVFFVSFGIVGLLFSSIESRNKIPMKIAYFVISTLLSFILSYIVWTIEEYIIVIGIILGVLLIIIVALFVVIIILNKKKE